MNELNMHSAFIPEIEKVVKLLNKDKYIEFWKLTIKLYSI